MGMFPVRIDQRTEVRVKDNVFSPCGCHLWFSLYRDGEYVADLSDLPDDWDNVVQETDDDSLIAAARRFAEAVSR